MTDLFTQYIESSYQRIPTAFILGMLLVYFVAIVLTLTLKGWQDGRRKVFGLTSIMYILVLFCSTLLFRVTNEETGSDFHPFWSYRAILGGRNDLVVENIMNFLVFVPVGFLFGCSFSKIKLWNVIVIGALVSSSIESLQFMFNRGFSEFDDVFHNVLGCIFGYGLYVLMVRIFKHKDLNKCLI